MYHVASTSLRERTWREPWASLFRLALYEAWRPVAGDLSNDEPAQFGIDAFDRLTQGQQAYLLLSVGRCLLIEKEPPLPLHQCVEAAAAVLFKTIADELQYEIDTPDVERYDFRRAVLACAMDRGEVWGDKEDEVGSMLPSVTSDEVASFLSELEDIEEDFSGDDDYLVEDPLSKVFDPDAPAPDDSTVDIDYVIWEPRDPNRAYTEYFGEELLKLSQVDKQLQFNYATAPEGLDEKLRFTALGADGRELQIVWYRAPDDSFPVSFLRTLDGWEVIRRSRGRYELLMTGESLMSNNPLAP